MKPYDDALQFILDKGKLQKNRTGIDTLSVFGMQTRYDISKSFPLLTARRVWPKSIFAELVWYLRGETNIYELNKLGSKIWDSWRDEEFEKKHHFSPGDLGPLYGHQFRHFNGEYKIDPFSYHQNRGFDQLEYICKLIRQEPDSRRILFSVWNPNQLDQMKLAPCHVLFQILLDNSSGEMTGILTQRSADYPVGVPANIQFYSALIYILCEVFGYRPCEFIHNTNDSHIYVNQIDAVNEYLAESALASSAIEMSRESIMLNLNKKEWADNTADVDKVLSYNVDDFILTNFYPERAKLIKMPVAV